MSAPAKTRASADVRAEMAQLTAERDADARKVEELQGGYNTVLLTGDDKAAERHEADTAKARRSIARANLRLPILAEELRVAAVREEDEREAVQRVEAEAAVEAVLVEVDAGYTEPARIIAAFLARWAAAADLARAAGIDTPDHHVRRLPDRVTPARDIVQEVEVDEQGREMAGLRPPPLKNYTVDPRTGEQVPDDGVPRRFKHKTVHVLEVRIPGDLLAPLAAAVALPPGRAGEERQWPAPKQAEPEAPKRAFGF